MPLVNQNIEVDLVELAKSTGWSVSGAIAEHQSCNDGNVSVIGYPIAAGKTYTFTYEVLTISGGNVRPTLGGVNGTAVTTTGLKTDTITATTDGNFYFYSNANCTIQAFTITDSTPSTDALPMNTIAFADKLQKWTSFYTFVPDCGTALFNQTIMFNDGDMYVQQNGTADRCNFFGTQYQAQIKFVEAKNPQVIKDFQTVNYQANMLLVSTINGILSSNGQVTTLIDTDFIKQILVDGALEITNYQVDNVYSASILGDQNEDNIVNSPGMRGNYLIVELVTDDGSEPLQLFTVGVRTRYVPIGPR